MRLPAIMLHMLVIMVVTGGLGSRGREALELRFTRCAACLSVKGRAGIALQRGYSRRHQRILTLITRCAFKSGEIIERAFQFRDQRAVRVHRNSQLGKPVHMGSGVAVLVFLREGGCKGRSGQKRGKDQAFHGCSPDWLTR